MGLTSPKKGDSSVASNAESVDVEEMIQMASEFLKKAETLTFMCALNLQHNYASARPSNDRNVPITSRKQKE